MLLGVTLLFGNTSWAQSPPRSYLEEGLMQNYPPSGNLKVDKNNWLTTPYNRYAFQHVSETHFSKILSRGAGKIGILNEGVRQLEGVTFEDHKGDTQSLREFIEASYTDAIIVIHDGKIILENYYNEQEATTQHIVFSITKSLLGTMVSKKIAEGVLNADDPLTAYIPELEKSGYASVTIQQLMDMTASIDYSENYLNPYSEIYRHMIAASYLPKPDNYDGPESIHEFIHGLRRDGKHGQRFSYISVNSEVLAWVVARATCRSMEDLFEEEIWQKIGAERDAYIISDGQGMASWSGGISVTARDLARFGLMMLRDGRFNANQCIPSSVVKDITQPEDLVFEKQLGKSVTKIPPVSYKNHWWFTNSPNKAYYAEGIYGQYLYIDPVANMVIVKQSSYHVPVNSNFKYDTMAAFARLGELLSNPN